VNGFDILKGVAGFLASAGTGAIVENVIRHTMPVRLTLVKKIFVVIGEVVVTGALSDLASAYAIEKVEKMETLVNSVKLAKSILEGKLDTAIDTALEEEKPT
jgi:hypothetical protein